jgi:hypothetical protein
VDQAENLMWLKSHNQSDDGWQEHYDVLVASVAREKGIEKEDARKYAEDELQRHGVPGSKPQRAP